MQASFGPLSPSKKSTRKGTCVNGFCKDMSSCMYVVWGVWGCAVVWGCEFGSVCVCGGGGVRT